MATWSVTVTNKGIALQTKQVNGATISFTRVVSGSGSVSIVNLKEQTAVKSIVQTLSMESLKVLDDTFKITVLLSNAEVTEGYNLSQIGFYATDPDEGEILFAIGQIDTPRAIPTNEDSPGYCLEFAFTFQNSNNVTIEITPDMSAYVTMNVVNDVVENAKDEMTISGAATGNPITIDDSADAPLNNIIVYGSSEQIKTNGYQLVDFSAGTNTSGTTSSFENDTITVSGDGTVPYQNWSKDITALITEHPGEIIWFDYGEIKTNVSHDGSIVQLNIALNDDTNIYGQLVTVSGIQRQYTIPDDTSNIKSVHLHIYTTNNTTAKANTVIIKKPMLQYGTDKKEYEPYTGRKPSPNPDYPQEIESASIAEIKSCGKNLLDTSLAVDKTISGITFTNNKDKSITINGTATNSIYYDVGLITLKPGKYIFSGCTGGGTNYLMYLQSTKSSEGYIDIKNGTKTLDVKETIDRKVLIAVYSGNTVSNVTFYPMIRKIDTDDSYEPYKETVAEFTDAIITRGIPVTSGGNYTDASGQQWICDEIDLARGVYVQRIKGQTITDTPKFIETSDIPGRFSWNCLSGEYENGRKTGILNFAKWTAWGSSDGTCDCGGINMSQIYYSPLVTMTADEVNSKFTNMIENGTPPVIIGQISTPIETPLTDEQITALQSLLTFEPTTNIFADDLANMDVEYFKNNGNGKAMAILKNENIELRKLIGDVNTVLESLIGGA